MPAPAQAQRGNFVILSATATEGGDLSFQVGGAATGEGAPTSDVTATCTASAGPTNPASPADLRATAGDTGPAAAFPTATLTFTPANYTTPQRCVFYTYDDNLLEPEETITVTLSVSGGGAVVHGDFVTARGVINDNDTPQLSIAVDDANTAEGDTAVFTVTLSNGIPAAGSPVTVDWVVGGAGITAGDVDQSAGTLTFTALGSETINLAIAEDNLNEAAETVTVTLSNPTGGGEITTASAMTTIAASDPITVTVDADSTAQLFTGATAEFTVALSVPSAAAVTVAYAVSGVVTDSGSLDFPPGATARPLSVAIPQDAIAGGGTGDLTVTLGAITVGDSGGMATAAAGNNAVVTVLGDNPAARAARVKTPLAVTAGHIGQLAARAVGERLRFDNVNTFNVAPAATAEELLRQTSFSLANGDSGINFWGGGSYVSAEGDDNGITYDGDTTAFHLGVDTGWNNGLLGITVTRSDSDMDFNNTDTLETEVTSVHPYLTRKFTNVQLWTTIGYGTGDAEIKEDDAVIKTDVTVTTAALGLTIAPTDGVTLIADGTYTRAQLDAAEANNRRLQKVTADNLRLNAAAELSGQRDAWRSFLTVNVRHDSGDGDTGAAGDLGGGLEWHSSTATLRLEGTKYLTGSGAEEERINLTARKTTGRLNLGLTIGVTDQINVANLLSGEWRW